MATTIPSHRLQLVDYAPRQYGALMRMTPANPIDPKLGQLIDIRASQINGCAFCLDMHWKDAKELGETDERLYMVAAWREATCYDTRERAALALTEAVTLIADGGVPDDVWEQAEDEFDPEELAQVIFAIANINTWNRLNVTVQTEAGHYVPGMFA
ncbi:MAG TPA: carboxymuconolactone decarboxylase family protein [Solirubrobacter sp.]